MIPRYRSGSSKRFSLGLAEGKGVLTVNFFGFSVLLYCLLKSRVPNIWLYVFLACFSYSNSFADSLSDGLLASDNVPNRLFLPQVVERAFLRFAAYDFKNRLLKTPSSTVDGGRSPLRLSERT